MRQQRTEILLDRELQCRVLGKFDEDIGSARDGRGDRPVEPDGVAQIPEPVVGDRDIGRHPVPQRRTDEFDTAVEEFAVVQAPADGSDDFVV